MVHNFFFLLGGKLSMKSRPVLGAGQICCTSSFGRFKIFSWLLWLFPFLRVGKAGDFPTSLTLATKPSVIIFNSYSFVILNDCFVRSALNSGKLSVMNMESAQQVSTLNSFVTCEVIHLLCTKPKFVWDHTFNLLTVV